MQILVAAAVTVADVTVVKYKYTRNNAKPATHNHGHSL